MSELLTFIFGPLAVPECLRGSRRAWVIWVRMFPAIAGGLVAFVVLWSWWMVQQFNPYHQPIEELRGGLLAIEGMLVVFAMILSPAVLAGSLAGEKERGSIGLILATRATAADIVLGRLAGRLMQVLMIEMAFVPSLLFLAALSGFGWVPTLTLLALPLTIAIGSAGMALGASAMSKRGRDALLLVYLVDILFLISPMLGNVPSLAWLGWISPFEPMTVLVQEEVAIPALITSSVWLVLGLLCLALGSWRLRPACLAEGSETRARKKAKRGRFNWVPPLDERPMLWKELYIERVGTLGRAGRWIGAFLVLAMGLGSIILASLASLDYWQATSAAWSDWSVQQLSIWYGGSGTFIALLIEWAIGLRAAVAISSERERGTWDALLTSPLNGSEIVRGKLWGSLYALRWLIGSAVVAWTISVSFGAMFAYEYGVLLVEVATVGAFMAALGVRTSLRSATATKAMGVTIGLWLAAYIVGKAISWFACLAVMVICVIGWLYATYLGVTTFKAGPWFPMSFQLGSDLVFYTVFLVSTFLVVMETRLRFDRVAGRMIEGKAALGFDEMIHGRPMAPVLLYPKPKPIHPDTMLGEAMG